MCVFRVVHKYTWNQISLEVFSMRERYYFYILKRKFSSNFETYFQKKYYSYCRTCTYVYGTMITDLNSVGFSPLLFSSCCFLGPMQITCFSQLSVELSSYLVYMLCQSEQYCQTYVTQYCNFLACIFLFVTQ